MADEIIIKRSSIDSCGNQNVTIQVGKEKIEMPIKLLKDFVINDSIKESYIPMPSMFNDDEDIETIMMEDIEE